MTTVQNQACADDCAACKHFRRGIAAATKAGNASLATDGRVLLARHQRNAADPNVLPWPATHTALL